MRITAERAIEIVAEQSAYNRQDIRQKNRQRRNEVVDLYGVEYTRQGDGGAPATFYISISPDMVYLERFEFKLIVQPFVTTVSTDGIQSAEVMVRETSLEATQDTLTGDITISPNPHTHGTEPHTHNVVAGISMVSTTADDFTLSIEGVDVTPYLMAQYGRWIEGEGVYPSLEIGRDYDILQVACDLEAEGRAEDARKLTSPGYKAIAIASSSPFQVTLVNYLKYSHLNR